MHVGNVLTVFTGLSGLTVFLFGNWKTPAYQQHSLSFSLILFHLSPKPEHRSPYGSTWTSLPPLYPHLCPLVIMPACPPVDCFLWVLQQHRTGYKSHCIITAPCIASRSARPSRASDWPLRLLGQPPQTGHRCNRTSRLLPWGRWLGERGSPWTVNHALSCAPRIHCCSLRRAECGATRRAAYQQRHTGAG